jgi:hypothetical protein
LADGAQKRVDRVADGQRVLLVGVGEIRRAYEAVEAHVGAGTVEVVVHEHPSTPAIGAHLESGAIGGEGIVAGFPPHALVVVRQESARVVLAVVEDDFEIPSIAWRRRPGFALEQFWIVGCVIAVANMLDVAKFSWPAPGFDYV